ncbi:MAG: trigger factor [Lentisphaeria bacterium]
MENNVIPLNIVAKETAPCCVTLTITVPAERSKPCYDGMVRKAIKEIKLPGFRAGKIPKSMVLKRYAGQINAETSEKLTNDSVQEAVEQEKYQLASSPKLVDSSIKLYEPGKDFSFEVMVEILPEVKVPDYAAFQLSKDAFEVKKDEVDKMINSWLEQRASYEKVESAAVQGDMLKATYCSEIPEDLKEEKKCAYILNAENTWVLLKSPEMLPGVSTALVGVKAGDTKDVTISFPDDFYMDLLRGRSIAYHFTIHEVQAKKLPEINEEFLKTAGVKTEEELRKGVEDSLKAQKNYEQQNKLREQVRAALISGQDFAVPPSMFERMKASELKRAKEAFMRNDKKEEDWKAKEKEEEQNAEKVASDNIRRSIVLFAIADQEKLQVEQNEIYQAVQSIAQQQNMKFDVAAKALQKNGAINGLMEELLLNKTLDFVISKANVVEAKAAVAE